jgi:hypothetical protein
MTPPSDVRVMLQFDDGSTTECTLSRTYFGQSSDGWMSLSCPLSVLKGRSGQSAYKIKRIVITGDGTQPFYVADLRTVTDSTAIQAVSAGSDKEVARNDRVTFRASCTPGMTAVRYSWDFDASNGIQNEAEGPGVAHKFAESGNFVVTVTAYDVFGVKAPATATCKVHVNL